VTADAGATDSRAGGGLPPGAYAWIASLLRVGLVASLALLVGGIVAYIALHPAATFDGVLHANPVPGILAASALASGLARGDPGAYLTVGVLVLIATPAARVVAGFVYFRRVGERALAAITLTVLALVIVGLLVVGPLVR
jgi:uncharacterized membrane protein